MELISQQRCFDGWLKRYRHYSDVCNSDMIFAIYLPPQAETQSVPVLYWLSGLTCTDENFTQKAGAQRVASELGMAIVCPDTSPRNTGIPGEADDINIGVAASFYVNATQEPWKKHYQMYDYIVDELPALVNQHFPITDRCSISGHSMGGHGAITIALRNPGKYCSVSALAPACHPAGTEHGRLRYTSYLGPDESTWVPYDSSLLVAQVPEEGRLPLLVDQGEDDEMLGSLQPKVLQAACEQSGYPLTLRMHPGYDHGYYFVSTFIEEHLRYHAAALASDLSKNYY